MADVIDQWGPVDYLAGEFPESQFKGPVLRRDDRRDDGRDDPGDRRDDRLDRRF